MLVCHVVYPSVQDSYCTLREKRHMTDQQIYILLHNCLRLDAMASRILKGFVDDFSYILHRESMPSKAEGSMPLVQ